MISLIYESNNFKTHIRISHCPIKWENIVISNLRHEVTVCGFEYNLNYFKHFQRNEIFPFDIIKLNKWNCYCYASCYLTEYITLINVFVAVDQTRGRRWHICSVKVLVEFERKLVPILFYFFILYRILTKFWKCICLTLNLAYTHFIFVAFNLRPSILIWSTEFLFAFVIFKINILKHNNK